VTRDLSADRAADFEEGPEVKIWRLERALAVERRFAAKSTRQLHRVIVRDLRRAEQRADAAEKRARRAERRAERAERELAELRRSATWRAGRVVVALPARLKRRRGSA
jgi:hypothetical protein